MAIELAKDREEEEEAVKDADKILNVDEDNYEKPSSSDNDDDGDYEVPSDDDDENEEDVRESRPSKVAFAVEEEETVNKTSGNQKEVRFFPLRCFFHSYVSSFSEVEITPKYGLQATQSVRVEIVNRN